MIEDKRYFFKVLWVFLSLMLCLSTPAQAAISDFSYVLNSIRNFASGTSDTFNFINDDEEDDVANISNLAQKPTGESNNKLVVLRVGFKSNVMDDIESLSGQSSDPDLLIAEDVVPEVIGQALVYPNPFRQSRAESAILGYRLSKDMPVTIHIYNMFAQLVAKINRPEGTPGGRGGYNKLALNQESFGGNLLSAGVYFYYLVHDGDVLAKGKMAVKP